MRKNIVLAVCLILALTFTAGTLHAKRKVSPLSKEFVNYPVYPELATEDGHGLGYRPDPADLSHLKDVDDPLRPNTYAAAFDLRTQGKLNSVRDQGGCGSCWDFATMASLESYLLPGEARNFSEQDLNANHGFDYAECAGGNRTMSMAYLTRWSGPLSETDVPYPYSAEGFTPLKHVQQLNYLPDRTSFTANDTLKYFLTTYGAVQVSYYHSNTFYNSTYKSYYKNTASTSTNHAVAVVGWDDNFPKANFKTTAPGNGAFIVRNSWGSSWGDGGYFYMSYYEPSVSNFVCFNNAESAGNYEYNYQYDLFGNIYGYGWGEVGFETAWGANIFTAAKPLSVKAVGFFANDVNAGYEIYVYTGVTAGAPVSGTLAATKTGMHTYAGFYTVQLDAPVSVANGELFSVVVKFMNSTYTYPIPCDGIVSGFSSADTSNAGESFSSDDGLVWYDLYVDAAGYGLNCNIKAYADANIPTPTLTLTSPNGGESWAVGSNQNIAWTSTGTVGNVNIDYSINNGSSWSPVLAGTTNDGLYP
jgi:C1A family cysteine protease